MLVSVYVRKIFGDVCVEEKIIYCQVAAKSAHYIDAKGL